MFSLSNKKNKNYSASIIKIDSFEPHPNADRLKLATVFGNVVITANSNEPGLYCYFPVECCISNELISFTNNFRDPNMNDDKKSTGFFLPEARVKALKLRNQKSEGFILPVEVLENFSKQKLNISCDIGSKHIGIDFDTFNNHQICKKFVIKNQKQNPSSYKKLKIPRLVEGQFHLHEDTSQLKRELNNIHLNNIITITNKMHGCNAIVSNVIVKKKLSLLQKIGKFFGMNIVDKEYGMVYSSRSVVKNANFPKENDDGSFNSDVWKIVADSVYPKLPEGYSVVGEIVGFTPKNSPIQKKYDYGCSPKQLDFYVFKVTKTSPIGIVRVLNHYEMELFCSSKNLKTPKTYYYGTVEKYLETRNINNRDEKTWRDDFLKSLVNEYLEKKCDICKNDVWAEGVVVRKENENHSWEAYKLKSFNFLKMESDLLDQGVVDMETAESQTSEKPLD